MLGNKKFMHKHTLNVADLENYIYDDEHSHDHKVVDSLGDEYVLDEENVSLSQLTLQ